MNTASWWRRPYLWLIAAIVLLGVAARVVLILSPEFTLDADKAVVYLIAVQQSHGVFSPLFWGQAYGGTIISVIAGALMWATGTSSPYFVLGVTFVMTLTAGVVLCRLAVLAIGRVAGAFVLALFLFPGAYLLRQSVDDGGFYASSLLFALTAIWISADPALQRIPVLVRGALIGLSAGVALWCSPMGFLLAVPALVLLLRQPSRWKALSTAIPATVIGASPYLVALVLPHGESGSKAHPFELTNITDRVKELLLQMIPGGFPLGHTSAFKIVTAATAVLLLILLWRTFRDKTGITFSITAGTILLLALLIVSGNPLDMTAARYNEFLLPGFSFAVASILAFTSQRVSVIVSSTVSTIAIIVTVTVLFDGMMIPQISPNQLVTAPPEWPSTGNEFGADSTQIAGYLATENVTAIWATYWLSYRISAASNGTITATDIEYNRYQPYRDAAEAANPAVIVVVAGSAQETSLQTSTTIPYARETTGLAGTSIFFYDHPLNAQQIHALLPDG